MNLRNRLARLEQTVALSAPALPALVVMPHESEAEARERYMRMHGFAVPKDAFVLRVELTDASRRQ